MRLEEQGFQLKKNLQINYCSSYIAALFLKTSQSYKTKSPLRLATNSSLSKQNGYKTLH